MPLAGKVVYPTVREIIAVVSDSYNVSYLDIISHRRPVWIFIPRQIVMYLARTMTPLSFPQIGRAMGNRDHTTIQHGYHKIEARMEKADAFRSRVEGFLAALTGVLQ